MKFFIALVGLSCAVSGGIWAATISQNAQSLLLYPGATIEFSAAGQCAVVRNISDTLVFVPLSTEAWPHFIRGNYPVVDVKECGRR